MTMEQINLFVTKWKISKQELARRMPMNNNTFASKMANRPGYYFNNLEVERLASIINEMMGDLANLMHGKNPILKEHNGRHLVPITDYKARQKQGNPYKSIIIVLIGIFSLFLQSCAMDGESKKVGEIKIGEKTYIVVGVVINQETRYLIFPKEDNQSTLTYTPSDDNKQIVIKIK